ncbi:MAG: DUF2892 domain-containing protein [Chloroflexota bacterium]
MKRLTTGMSYTFNRNLGWQDRLIRAVGSLGILTLYGFGIFSGPIGLILAILAGMVLVTAVISRCSICYIAGVCTIGPKERMKLDNSGIKYENA